MRFNLFYLTGLLFILSCNNFDGPFYETIESYTFNKIGDAQKTNANNYFSDSIGIAINKNLPDNSTQGFSARFTVISGGGSLDDNDMQIINGTAKTRWKSGSISTEQKVRIDIYDKKNNFLNKITIVAFAFRKEIWDTIPSNSGLNISDVLADTIRNKTFAIINGNIYLQKENYYTWELQTIGIENAFSMHIDVTGKIYISTWNGLIYKSTDGGINWNLCTKPITNHIYYYYMNVSNNGYLWASSPDYSHGLRCSRDGGNTWTVDTIGLIYNELMGDIYKLSNGDMLFHSLNTMLYKSTDDGKTWQVMDCPPYSTKLFVDEKEEMIIFNQENGVSIHKSTDFGKTFRKVYSVWPEYGTIMSKIIQKKGNYYYILIPGYGIIRTLDFEKFETFSPNTKIVYLYLTHDGVLIARGLDNNTIYFYRD